jgi:regulator of replication initiation timing
MREEHEISNLERMIKSTNESIGELRTRLDHLFSQRGALELRLDLLVHNCSCVRINRTIGIYTSANQEGLGRVHVGRFGIVSETLSADKNCLICKGTGKRNET